MGRRIPLALVLVLFVGVAACSDDSTGTETTSETVGTEAPSESTPPATDASTTAESTSTAPDLPVVTGPEDWDPILATVQAGEAPPAATCPEGTDPDTPGPVDQDRPQPGSVGNRQATFDRHLGRIMYMDVANQTWTFDVCTNTWTNMNPGGAADVFELVYDVDSDVTVGFGLDRIWVYDAATNTWSEQDTPSPRLDLSADGTIYDPLSGLIISNVSTLRAYDVDTDTWIDVGSLDERNSTVGYSVELDKLVRYQLLSNYGDLLDPRTGDIQPLPPTPDFGGGFGVIDYAADTDTAYVMDLDGKDICGFDPDTLGWQPCFDPADGPVTRPIVEWGAMVGDPINNRLILINAVKGPRRDLTGDDVWAIDLDTGEWTEILAPSTTGIASTTRPWHTTESAHTDPADAVGEFMDFIGFIDSATQGPFQQGDSRSGEIEIDPFPNFGDDAEASPDDPLPTDDVDDPFPTYDVEDPYPIHDTTTVLVRLDDDNNWVVTGSASTAIVVDEPTSGTPIWSPLDTHFTYFLAGSGVVMQLWPDGVAEPIVDERVTSGSGIFAYDVWDSTVEWAPGTTGPATAIYVAMEHDPVAVTAFQVELTN